VDEPTPLLLSEETRLLSCKPGTASTQLMAKPGEVAKHTRTSFRAMAALRYSSLKARFLSVPGGKGSAVTAFAAFGHSHG
jgi:hypothetical protein